MGEKTRSEYKEVPRVYSVPGDMKALLAEIEIRKSLNLHQRIAAITGECQRIPKNGWNDFHGFPYVTQADTVAMTSQLCAKYGVTIVSQPVSYPKQIEPMVQAFVDRLKDAGNQDEIEYLGQELRMMISAWRKPEHLEWTDKQELGTMLFEFTVTNADHPDEHFVRYAWGEGLDGGDKLTYKCWSGAEKYFLFKLFQIPADTESDQGGIGKDERRSAREEDDAPRSSRKPSAQQRDAKPAAADNAKPAAQKPAAAPAELIKFDAPTFKDIETDIEVGKGDKKKIVKETWTQVTGTALGNGGPVERGPTKALCVTIGIAGMVDYKAHPKERNNRFDCYHKSLFDALALVKRGSKVTFQFRTEVSGDKSAAPGTVTQYIEDVMEIDGRKFEDGVEVKVDPTPPGPSMSPTGLFEETKKSEAAEPKA